jgi:putative transposase
MESRYIHKRHNVSVEMYHVVCAAKYRWVVMSKEVDEVLRQACLDIEKRWEIWFLEIGLDRDHAHFLIQTVPTYSPSRVVQTVKGVIAREVFAKALEVKRQLWGGAFWGEGYFVNTVGQHGSEKVIAAYVQGQGGQSEYRQLHKGQVNNPRSLLRGLFT